MVRAADDEMVTLSVFPLFVLGLAWRRMLGH